MGAVAVHCAGRADPTGGYMDVPGGAQQQQHPAGTSAVAYEYQHMATGSGSAYMDVAPATGQSDDDDDDDV